MKGLIADEKIISKLCLPSGFTIKNVLASNRFKKYFKAAVYRQKNGELPSFSISTKNGEPPQFSASTFSLKE